MVTETFNALTGKTLSAANLGKPDHPKNIQKVFILLAL